MTCSEVKMEFDFLHGWMLVHCVPFKTLGPANSPHEFSRQFRVMFWEKKKHCLFCWPGVNIPGAHQSLLAVWVQDVLPALPAVRARETCVPYEMFPSAESGCCEPNTQLFYFVSLSSHREAHRRWIPAVTTLGSRATPWPSSIQNNGMPRPNLSLKNRNSMVAQSRSALHHWLNSSSSVPLFCSEEFHQFTLFPFINICFISAANLACIFSCAFLEKGLNCYKL